MLFLQQSTPKQRALKTISNKLHTRRKELQLLDKIHTVPFSSQKPANLQPPRQAEKKENDNTTLKQDAKNFASIPQQQFHFTKDWPASNLARRGRYRSGSRAMVGSDSLWERETQRPGTKQFNIQTDSS